MVSGVLTQGADPQQKSADAHPFIL
jgi:hypothetical protein